MSNAANLSDLLLSPPIAALLFLALIYGLYRLGGALSAPAHDEPGKHQPYACGEDLEPAGVRLTYHAFFRLVLMFGVLHLAALTLATLPRGTGPHRVAMVYLVGIAISVLVLARGERDA
jgi:NADH:ubiquinone oxidoreductase subunit 3 (subunit A)